MGGVAPQGELPQAAVDCHFDHVQAVGETQQRQEDEGRAHSFPTIQQQIGKLSMGETCMECDKRMPFIYKSIVGNLRGRRSNGFIC